MYCPARGAVYRNEKTKTWRATYDDHFRISHTYHGVRSKRTEPYALQLTMHWVWSMDRQPHRAPTLDHCKELVEMTHKYVGEQAAALIVEKMEKAKAEEVAAKEQEA